MAEFPLLFFTIFTGFAAGSYIMATIFGLIDGHMRRTFIFDLVILIALGIGLLAALAHLGHPERVLNALANPSSMITQEALWSIPFGVIVLIDTILQKVKPSESKVLPIIGSLVACGLLVVTSLLYFGSYGVPGWANPATLFQFIVADLAIGAAFTVAFLHFDKQNIAAIIACVVDIVLAVAYIAEAVVFSATAVGPLGFIVATILAVAAAVLAYMLSKGKENLGWIVFGVVVLAVVIARFAFYSATF